jgi:hypothetical protein
MNVTVWPHRGKCRVRIGRFGIYSAESRSPSGSFPNSCIRLTLTGALPLPERSKAKFAFTYGNGAPDKMKLRTGP